MLSQKCNDQISFEITALSKAFAAVHEAQLRERQENLLCDQCPMRWFSQLCAEVEGNTLCEFLCEMLFFCYN